MKFFKLIFKVMCMVTGVASSQSVFSIDNPSEKIHSNIHEISTLNEIKNYAQENRPDIIAFDIDKTLITYKDAISQNGVNEFMRILKSDYNLEDDRAKLLMSIILSTSHYKLMEDNIDEMLNDLSQYSPNIIALTNCRTGEFGKIKNVEEWKTNLLKDFGITFLNHDFYAFNKTVFDNLLTDSQKNDNIQYPIFLDGLLYTGKYVNKGILMKEFLSKSSIPNSMLIIDDQKRNLDDLQETFQDTNINLTLLLYKPKDEIRLDNKIVEIQKKILVEEERWVNDTEALSYLKSNPTI